MKKVLTIGGAVYDIFIEYQSPETLNLHTHDLNKRFLVLEEGAKVEVQNLAYRSGGGATNSAVSFQKLGYNTSSFFKIGSTDFVSTNFLTFLLVFSNNISNDPHFENFLGISFDIFHLLFT